MKGPILKLLKIFKHLDCVIQKNEIWENMCKAKKAICQMGTIGNFVIYNWIILAYETLVLAWSDIAVNSIHVHC